MRTHLSNPSATRQEQEARDEDPHASKDEEEDTKIAFKKAANVIHSATIDESTFPFIAGCS